MVLEPASHMIRPQGVYGVEESAKPDRLRVESLREGGMRTGGRRRRREGMGWEEGKEYFCYLKSLIFHKPHHVNMTPTAILQYQHTIKHVDKTILVWQESERWSLALVSS